MFFYLIISHYFEFNKMRIIKMSTDLNASKCYDIHISLGAKQVPEFEYIPKIGMMISLSLHLRGLPLLEYEKLKLICGYYFKIPTYILKEILENLESIGFVKLFTEGETIKKVQPQVPYFSSVYSSINEYSAAKFKFSEHEELALDILNKLSVAPTEQSNIYDLGAEKKVVDRNLSLGKEGGYIVERRARGRSILISPVYFSENADLFVDLTAKAGTKKIKRVLELVQNYQGIPLSVIESTGEINGIKVNADDKMILRRLAEDGAIKPPSIQTAHSGINHFMFTPAPGASKLNPSKREVYERAMAIVSSVRQGEFLAAKYRIKYPALLLKALKRNGYLRATSESYDQYQQLAYLRVGKLVKVVNDRYRFELIQLEENMEALDLAISLIDNGNIKNMEINDDAIMALNSDQTYIESIISSQNLREADTVTLDEESQAEFDNLLLTGAAQR